MAHRRPFRPRTITPNPQRPAHSVPELISDMEKDEQKLVKAVGPEVLAYCLPNCNMPRPVTRDTRMSMVIGGKSTTSSDSVATPPAASAPPTPAPEPDEFLPQERRIQPPPTPAPATPPAPPPPEESRRLDRPIGGDNGPAWGR
jgi:hypothetical protein